MLLSYNHDGLDYVSLLVFSNAFMQKGGGCAAADSQS
jgi:hypothetical protein